MTFSKLENFYKWIQLWLCIINSIENFNLEFKVILTLHTLSENLVQIPNFAMSAILGCYSNIVPTFWKYHHMFGLSWFATCNNECLDTPHTYDLHKTDLYSVYCTLCSLPRQRWKKVNFYDKKSSRFFAFQVKSLPYFRPFFYIKCVYHSNFTPFQATLANFGACVK